MTQYLVRAAQISDLPSLLRIERSAAKAFRDIGYPQLADGRATPVEMFEAGLEKGCLWAAIKPDNIPVGFALCALMDNLFYLEDISVDPDFQRRGIGDLLLLAIMEHARFLYCSSVILSTLSTAPWSMAFYRKHGFLVADMEKLPKAVRQQFQIETGLGLPAKDRIVMVKRI